MRVLLLGGTSEARVLAERLAGDARFDALLSLAGRTLTPNAFPIPVRNGGFGGADGLAAALANERFDVLLDATHPFAAEISANAVLACERRGTPLIAIERPPWKPGPGDKWRRFATVDAAIEALPETPACVFSALGRQSLGALAAAPHRRYVIRVVDPVPAPAELTDAVIISAIGPFRLEDDVALFRQHGIDAVLAKNSGGSAAISKIEAARALGLTVYMVDRPVMPQRPVFHSIDDAWRALTDHHASSAKRGV
ncbi:MAG: cobalt-precorrin-6A reductase [Hyphomicrobium sp.]